jgi:uroporphyrin-III C-methyltransferase
MNPLGLDAHDDPLRLGLHPQPGEVWLVGAGPGDAGLLTLKGWAALLAADVVVHDRLGCEELLLRLPASIRRIDVGKLPGERRMTQDRINAILEQEARAGRVVVRLKGGDPFVFGRGSEEIAHLRRIGVPIRIVPGVSSAIAGPGAAAIPVTHRAVARGFTVATGRDEEGLTRAAAVPETRIFLMGIDAIDEITSQLLESGLPPETPAAVVSSATTYRQRSVQATLSTIAEQVRAGAIEPPAVLVVGPTAGEEVAGELLSLPGGILVTGSRIPAALARSGAPIAWRPLHLASYLDPATSTVVRPRLLETLAEDWVIAFHGVPAVEGWLEEVARSGRDLRAVRARLHAIGREAARALERWRLLPDAVSIKGARVALACEEDYAGSLPAALLAQGASEVQLLPVHRWEPQPPAASLDWRHLEAVTFTSPRALRRFLETYPTVDRGRLRALCVGEQLCAEAAAHGFRLVEPLG